jgi:hypothetical protein
MRTNVDPELVFRKSQLGIYFALFAIAALAKDNWGDTDTHPALRIQPGPDLRDALR